MKRKNKGLSAEPCGTLLTTVSLSEYNFRGLLFSNSFRTHSSLTSNWFMSGEGCVRIIMHK